MYEQAEIERDPFKPMVGIHIRRTDKIIEEAQYHGIEEYMTYVEEYFLRQEMKNGVIIFPKQVFIASDDPMVFAELRQKYPNYKFIGNESRANSASLTNRYNIDSLKKTMVDVHMLSLSDYIVCTFSSNLARTAYELQQQRYSDSSKRVKSLDEKWHFGN